MPSAASVIHPSVEMGQLTDYYCCGLQCDNNTNNNNNNNSLGKRLTLNTGDIRKTAFLFQRLSTSIQRFTALAFRGTFGERDIIERVAVGDSIIM